MSAIAPAFVAARPWGRAAAWLAFLAPFFYLTYGTANHLASQRAGVPSLVFAWEQHIPFLAWTILPYWSINAFYGVSLFVARTRHEVDAHGCRLLVAQLIAVACFLLLPLQFTFERPAVEQRASRRLGGDGSRRMSAVREKRDFAERAAGALGVDHVLT